jgi:hypothetical protein
MKFLLLGLVAGASYFVFWQTAYDFSFVLISVVLPGTLSRRPKSFGGLRRINPVPVYEDNWRLTLPRWALQEDKCTMCRLLSQLMRSAFPGIDLDQAPQRATTYVSRKAAVARAATGWLSFPCTQ